MKKLLVAILVVWLGWWLFVKPASVALGPGVMAPEDPKQNAFSQFSSITVEGYEVIYMASFDIKAKVLSRKNYYTGRQADLSPVDLALGWGPMSDEAVLDHINISQSGRWYRWQTDAFPIPRRDIEIHSANMHLIPANDQIEKAMKKTRQGDIVQLSGKLVDILASDGWRWTSSMTREDTGNNACEVIWVDDFRIVTE